MTRNRATNWMACYDIADPARLNRVHRIVSKFAVMVQYSVYYLHADDQELDRLLDALGSEINHREDDIRIYPVPETPNAVETGHDIIAQAVLRAGANETVVLGDPEEITGDHRGETPKGQCNTLNPKQKTKPADETETR